jgi:hypothetical protein
VIDAYRGEAVALVRPHARGAGGVKSPGGGVRVEAPSVCKAPEAGAEISFYQWGRFHGIGPLSGTAPPPRTVGASGRIRPAADRFRAGGAERPAMRGLSAGAAP